MKKLVLRSMLFLLVLASQAFAQDRTISGTVTDKEKGEPIPGVSVLVVGTKVGAQTDVNGKYTITAPSASNQLLFSFVGYISQTLTITGNTLNVSLGEDSKQLSEVIITGFSTQKREEFTGSAARIGGDAIKDKPVQSFGQALTGQAAGVNIVQPNGTLNNAPVIRVRGINSISLNSFPLIVVDGIPIATDNISTNQAPNNPLGDINPADIESIDILKDAASASVYGSRASNGVLVITTKKGKQGKAKVTYDGWFGVSNAVRLPEVLNAQQYIDYKNEAAANLLVNNPSISTATLPRDAVTGKTFFADELNGQTVDTKWYDYIYKQAVSQNHALTISGANQTTNYFLSLGYTDQEGFLRANTFERRSARLNLNHKVTDWLNLSGNINYSNAATESPNSGSIPGSAFDSYGLGRIAVAMGPNIRPYNADGSYYLSGTTIGAGKNLLPQQWVNPLPVIELDQNRSETNRIIANVSGNVNILTGLTFKTSYSWDRSNVENIQFYNPFQGQGQTSNGSATNANVRRDNWNLINTLQYQKSFNQKHNLTLLAGSDIQKTITDSWGAIRQNLTDPYFEQFAGSYFTNLPSLANNFENKRAYESYLGTLNYNYANKYFFSANFRRDGNSALSANNRWGNFGGVSAGWSLSEEQFYKNLSFSEYITNVRLKGSWGRVGNGNLNTDFASLEFYNAAVYGASASAYIYAQPANNQLRWETSDQTNFGLEFGILNDRITFSAEYYNNNVNGLILAVPQAPSKGIPNPVGNNTILENVGSMYNRGIELSLTANPINKGKFSWNTNFNISFNKNRVTSLFQDNSPIITATSGLETTSITSVGHPVGSIYAVRTAGVNPANGRRIFINKNGQQVQYNHLSGVSTQVWTFLDGTTASPINGSDAQIIGGALPTWFGGFTNTFKYGNFDFDFLFTYSGGNYIYNGSRAGLLDQRAWNNTTDVLNRWTTPGQQTNIPRPVLFDNVSNGSSFAIDANVEKGDFLRLQTATLGYKLPQKLFGKSGINSLRIYAQVNNAFIVTKYSGVDPEISTNGNANTAPGVERNTIPQGRAFTFGVNLGF